MGLTKEELYKKCYEVVSRTGKYDMGNIVLDKFFDSNVCIPKGINRVKFADELHLMLEGIEIKSIKTEMQLDGIIPWIRCDIKNIRIKPQEPVYEWQWYIRAVFNGGNGVTPYMTDEEFNNSTTSRGHSYHKIEESKRIRQ